MKTILLYGPNVSKGAAYGGGQGGYVRNMKAHLGFASEQFCVTPVWTTVRQKGEGKLRKITRWFEDVSAVNSHRHEGDGIHIVAQYRLAIYREYAVVKLCQRLQIPVLYEIKAGAFLNFLDTCLPHERWMTSAILRASKVVMCEGQPYVDALRERYGIDAHYFPNYVPIEEVPDTQPRPFQNGPLRVLFVGYCYEGKGVFELLNGCILAAQKGIAIDLTFAGREHDDFTTHADQRESELPSIPLTVNRLGTLDHEAILDVFAQHDVFVMASRHPGEGHTNTVNEAMMMGLSIVATRHGFLETVLTGDCALFLEQLTAESIADALTSIDNDREAAQQRARNGRARLEQLFTSNVAHERLETAYAQLTDTPS